MREVIAEVEAWRSAGKKIAIAMNVKKDGTSLRPLGAKMALTADMKIAGSLTGGCIEGAVYEEALTVLREGRPKLVRYGVPDDERPWEIGLSCGSSLEVLIEALDAPAWEALYPALKTCLEENQLVAVTTVIAGEGMGNKMLVWPDGRRLGSLGAGRLDAEAALWAQEQMRVQESGWREFEAAQVFVDVLPPPARLLIVGAVHIAIPLVTLAKTLGYRTIVVDPRTAFATRERFPHADELLVEWPAEALARLRPDENTYIAVLSHDEKLDNPALKVALESPARYVGVLGSRKNIGKRLAALRELGVTEERLSRLHAPIGIPLGAVEAEEIALSILAAVTAAKHGALTSTPQKGMERLVASEQANEAVKTNL
jgi:xanthine dehydrogenase accessory factor